MTRTLIVVVALIAVLITTVTYVYVTTTGLTSQPDPGQFETVVARRLRALAVPRAIRDMPNPVPASAEATARGMGHFAQYCALCHGNDGSGTGTAFGRGFYPKAPDMRQTATQALTDGELFYIIENGVRFTGMPAFGSGTADPKGETLAWQLVHFIRRLPNLTADEVAEMTALNPL
ncbi:MAG: cytochrome c [Vicinamibacterales bacterium]